ncbi:hypothetical protein APHAL10511_007491 [Amanita phalloides]|nr:hypothetical protein APHAL10511_007491 [Amanita phalloides]
MAQIVPGSVYHILNVKAENTAIDLSGSDQRSIIGWPAHSGDNQKWHVEKTNNHLYTLRNVLFGKYLALTQEPHDNLQAVATEFEYEWDIRPDGEDPSVLRIFVPHTHFNLDLTNHGSSVGNTPIATWGTWEGRNQCWRFEQV